MRLQPQKIMCAVDFSDSTSEILVYSVALCREFQAKLFLVHIVDDVKTSFVDSGIVIDDAMLQEQQHTKAQELLEDLAQKVGIEHEVIISQGNSADKICQLAAKEQIDMVITASHGKSGFERLLIGSVTEKLQKSSTARCW